jgi:hypothetical protein
MKHLKTIAGTIFITMLLVLPFFVFADDPALSEPNEEFVDNSDNGGLLSTSNPAEKLADIAGKSGYGEADLPSVAGIIIRSALGLLGTIFIVMIIVAGVKWLSAGGDEKEVTTAKDYIKRAIIGLVITLSAWAIWSFLARILAG